MNTLTLPSEEIKFCRGETKFCRGQKMASGLQVATNTLATPYCATLRFIINGGGLRGFSKNDKRGDQNKRGVGTKYKRKETKIELSL